MAEFAEKELISFKSYNSKIRNYLRDYLVYQYKNEGSDFKDKGFDYPKDEKGRPIKRKGSAISNVDKDIDHKLIDEDTERLFYILQNVSDIIWNYNEPEEVSHNRQIQLDSRHTKRNPFFSTYKYCERYEKNPGEFYARICAIILQMQIGTKIDADGDLSDKECELLDKYLKDRTIALYANALSLSYEPNWDDLSVSMKERYAAIAIKKFLSKDTSGFGSDRRLLYGVYDYVVRNNQAILLEENTFIVRPQKYIEKNTLFELLSEYYLNLGERTFRNDMDELSELGFVKKNKEGKTVYYALNDIYIFDEIKRLGIVEDFMEMLAFFSRTHVLGEVGDFILSRFPNFDPHIRYKHDYPQKTLNDVNVLDILGAINNRQWLLIEYRNAASSDMKFQKFLCYPLEIRESVNDGRQYLIFYHAGYRSVSAIRIEFIDDITICTPRDKKLSKIIRKARTISSYPGIDAVSDAAIKKEFENDLVNAAILVRHTWGTSFRDFQKGNVISAPTLGHIRLVVKYKIDNENPKEDESFIPERIRRELRNIGTARPVECEGIEDNCYEFVAEVVDPYEVLQWARSYTTRIVLLEINGKRDERYSADIEFIHRAYQSHTVIPRRVKKANIDKTRLLEPYDFSEKSTTDDKIMFTVQKNYSASLFNEYYGLPFETLCDLLFYVLSDQSCNVSDIANKIKCLTSYSSCPEKRIDQAQKFIQPFIDSNMIYLSEDCSETCFKDFIPLSLLEQQWLLDILNEPMAKCFLEEESIGYLKNKIGEAGVIGGGKVVLYDRFINSMGESPNLGLFVRCITKAVRENKKLGITYPTNDNPEKTIICEPGYLMYSKRNNCFQLYALNEEKQVSVYNLERAINIEILDDNHYDSPSAIKSIDAQLEAYKTLVVIFTERNNIPDKILTEFSPWKKTCCRCGENQYRMTLYYDKYDKREILIRLLSYGSSIYVESDTGYVRKELRERVRSQIALNREKHKVITKDRGER